MSPSTKALFYKFLSLNLSVRLSILKEMGVEVERDPAVNDTTYFIDIFKDLKAKGRLVEMQKALENHTKGV